MISRISSVPATTWPPGWEDVEVVDSVIVEEAPPEARRRFARRDGGTGVYDRFGRVPAAERYGRLISVLA